MENNDYVSFDLAVKLKDAGFDKVCRYYYKGTKWKQKSSLPSRRKHPRSHKAYMEAINRPVQIELLKEDVGVSNHELESPLYPSFHWMNECIIPHFSYASAPTLAQAQKWLREKEYAIEPRVWLIGSTREYRPYIMPPKKRDYIALPSHETYESALSAGIEAALKLIEEGES